MTDKSWDRYKSMRGRWIPLSVRETYLSDYGITHEQGKKIIDYCRKATGYEQILLLQSCQNVNPEIANFLFINLTTGLGYDNICKREYIPMQRKDFQGYRRKVIEEYNRLMTLLGRPII